MSELSATLDEAFNTQTEEGTPDFQPLPAGNYVATIVDAKVGPLKSGKGQAVLLQWEVQNGANQGRLIFDRVIVAHESAEAMKFGRRKLKDIADACGLKDFDHRPDGAAEQALLNLREDRAGRCGRVSAQEPGWTRQAECGAREDERRQAGLQRPNSILNETGNTGAGVAGLGGEGLGQWSSRPIYMTGTR